MVDLLRVSREHGDEWLLATLTATLDQNFPNRLARLESVHDRHFKVEQNELVWRLMRFKTSFHALQSLLTVMRHVTGQPELL